MNRTMCQNAGLNIILDNEVPSENSKPKTDSAFLPPPSEFKTKEGSMTSTTTSSMNDSSYGSSDYDHSETSYHSTDEQERQDEELALLQKQQQQQQLDTSVDSKDLEQDELELSLNASGEGEDEEEQQEMVVIEVDGQDVMFPLADVQGGFQQVGDEVILTLPIAGQETDDEDSSGSDTSIRKEEEYPEEAKQAEPEVEEPTATVTTTTTTTTTAATTTTTSTTRVKFDQVFLHEFPLILGDNPAVSKGAPVTIDWKACSHDVMDLEIYEYLRAPERRHRRKFLLSASRRAKLCV